MCARVVHLPVSVGSAVEVGVYECYFCVYQHIQMFSEILTSQMNLMMYLYYNMNAFPNHYCNTKTN